MAFGFIRKVFSFGKDKLEEAPADAPVVEPAVVSEAAAPDLSAEITPPLREPSPVHADPLREEIAPEMDAIPAPAENLTAGTPATLPEQAGPTSVPGPVSEELSAEEVSAPA